MSLLAEGVAISRDCFALILAEDKLLYYKRLLRRIGSSQ